MINRENEVWKADRRALNKKEAQAGMAGLKQIMDDYAARFAAELREEGIIG